jgi:hypothetical protein
MNRGNADLDSIFAPPAPRSKWVCGDFVTDVQAAVEDLLFLASDGRFVFVSSMRYKGDFGARASGHDLQRTGDRRGVTSILHGLA